MSSLLVPKKRRSCRAPQADGETPDAERLPRAYWRLWLSQLISLLGSQVGGLALPLLALTSAKGGPLGVGAIIAARYVPFVLLAIPAGALADRWPQRRTMVACDLARVAILLWVLGAAATGGVGLPALVVAAFASGTLTVLFDTAAQAYVPRLTGRRQLLTANRWLQSSQSVSDLTGPAVAGAIIAGLGAVWALCLDAASFAVSALLLWGRSATALGASRDGQERPEDTVREVDGDPVPEAPRRATEGVRVLLRDARLRALTLEAAFFNLFDQGLLTLFLVYAVTDLGLGVSAYGLVLSAAGVGTLIGSLLGDRAAGRVGVGRLLIGSGLAGCAGNLLIPAAGGGNWLTTAALASGLFLSGIATGISNVQAVTLRQLLAHPAVMGRVAAAFRAAALGTIPIGAFGAGLLGEWLGLRPSLWILAVGTLTTPLWLLFSPIRSLRSFSEVT